jgi:hypothetical protein
MARKLVLEHGGERLPYWLLRISACSGLAWTIGIGLIIALWAMRWILQRRRGSGPEHRSGKTSLIN